MATARRNKQLKKASALKGFLEWALAWFEEENLSDLPNDCSLTL